MLIAYATTHQSAIWVISNHFSQATRRLLQETKTRHPLVQIQGWRKPPHYVFTKKATQHAFVDPTEFGIECPHPSSWMGGMGYCGTGVTSGGYCLCTTAGTINSILGLNAAATKLAQMRDREFVRWQARTICSHCGMFLPFDEAVLAQTTRCNGTLMSNNYLRKLQESGRWPINRK
jgi:hypothetical protein